MKIIIYKLSAFVTAILLTLNLVSPAYAVGPLKNPFGGTPPGVLKKLVRSKAIINGTIASINGSTLTLTGKDSKTYTVNTDFSTKLRRRYWGIATLSEMQVGDNVNIIGKWTDDAHTIIAASRIRDLSIMKRHGVFIGDVTSLSSSGWVIQTVKRGSQTVTVTSTTRFVNRKEQTISKSDITVGHRVRVIGLWDNKSNTITEVRSVKDYSLPPKTSVTITPTGV